MPIVDSPTIQDRLRWTIRFVVTVCIRDKTEIRGRANKNTAVTNRVVEYLVGATDAGHVLFGTDAPMRDPRPQLGWVVWADLPSEDRLRIVGANFDGILARAGGGVAGGC